MRSLKFPQANKELAKGQNEYNNLHAFYGVIGATQQHTGFIVCFEPSEEEIKEITINKKIWLSQLTFGNKFNPVSIFTTNDVFSEEEVKVQYNEEWYTTVFHQNRPFWKKFFDLFKKTTTVTIGVKHTGYASKILEVDIRNHVTDFENK